MPWADVGGDARQWWLNDADAVLSVLEAGEQEDGPCAHEWVYDSEGDYGECKLCDASINVVAGFSRTIHQPLPVRPPTGEQESDQ